jgi:hypothetical protein
MLQDDYEFYRSKSKRELLETLAKMTQEQKQNGTLGAASMEETYRMLSPLLDNRQKQLLRALIDELK